MEVKQTEYGTRKNILFNLYLFISSSALAAYSANNTMEMLFSIISSLRTSFISLFLWVFQNKYFNYTFHLHSTDIFTL